MNAVNLLSELRRLKIEIWAEGEQLRVNAPEGALTPALRGALRECKRELLALISSARATDDQAYSPIPRLSRQEPLPLSFAQERLWFLDRLHPGSTVYNIPLAVRLRGVLDAGALERSLRTIVARHEPLRTVFREDLAGTAQVILPAGEWHLGHEEVPDGEANRETWVHAWCRRVAQEPFDLERGPMFRARLLRVGAADHVLSLAMHHIVADGWSLGVLVRELTALYEAEVGGKQTALPPLPIQYADFAAWQRQWLKGAVLDDQLDYWRKRLMGLGVLELPTDRPRPPMPAYKGAVAEQRLGSDLIASLKAFAQREGATLFMVLLTGFQILLARYSGQDDVAVGTPIANRRRTDVEGLIGFFANTLVLRTDLGGDLTVREAVKRVRDGALGAYEHQDVPFEKLVEVLQPVRDGSHHPLFQVLLALQNAELPRLELPGLTLTPLEFHNGTAKCDLTLECSEEPDGARLTWEYDEALFDGASIGRMQGHFERVLEMMVADPDTRLSRLPLLTAAERTQLLEEWNGTAEAYAEAGGLHDLIAAQAARTPGALAVAYEGRGLTYGELERRANQVAHALRKRGVGPDVLVGIAMERSLELLVGVLGILKAGGAYVPIDPDYPAERVAYMLEDAQVPVLLTQAALRARLPAPGAEVLCLDGDAAWLTGEPTTAPEAAVGPEQLAYVIYTSGSTGRPKGAMNTHRGIGNRLQWMQATYGLTAADRVLQKTPISFDVSVWELFWPLMTGATLVLARPGGHRDPSYLVEAIQRERITVLHFVPSMLQVFLAEPGVEGCRTVRQVICSGEALPYELAQRCMARLPGARLDNLYGPTEAAVDVTWWRCELAGPRGLVPIGKPVANTQIYIVDGQGEPVPVGVAGELCIGGVQVGRGYWRRPELTAERFVPDPFSGVPGARLYRTGDRARYLADGNIEYLGRLDFQVKIRGFRIELGEIEAVLGQQAGVREVVVVAREDAQGDKRLVAYVVPQEGTEPVGDALRAALRTALPEYMVPAAYVVLPALPLTGSGKVDRRALPAPGPPGSSPGREYTAPRTETERAIAGIWEELLGVPAVGIHDNFFDLGGHSLLATRLVLRLSRALGVQVPLRRLFERPTVADVGECVEEARRGETQQAEAADILSRLDGLSDGEVDVLLAQLQHPSKNGTASSEQVGKRELLVRLLKERAAPRAESGGAAITRVDRDRPLALSFAQQRLWMVDQLAPGGATYNMWVCVRLEGALDKGALERTLAAIVARHEPLRTVFPLESDQPVQVIQPAHGWQLDEQDFGDMPGVPLDVLVQERCRVWAQEPFDLGAGPLFRARLWRVAPEEHVLGLAMHHIVADEWSLAVLLQELFTGYEAERRGTRAAWRPLPIQYADYASWQRGWLQGDVLEQHLAYWRRQLAGAPVLELPTDRPRPMERTQQGALASRVLPARLGEALGALARREGATLFMTLLAGLQTLLHRYTGETDISVGSPIANRTRPEVERLIGFFLNMLVLRVDLGDDPSFRELLKRVKETCLGAYAHQDMPFEKLVEQLAPARTNRSPLFQVMLVFEEAIWKGIELPGLAATPLQLSGDTAKFDLTLYLTRAGSDLVATIEYSTELFDRATMERWLGSLEELLGGIVANPDTRLSRLPLLTEAERTQLLEEWNGTAEAYAEAGGLHDLIAAQAARTPGALAVEYEGRGLTYGELERRANQVAHALRKRGVGPEVLVGIAMERSLELMVGVLGILKAGGAYVPIDPDYPAERVAYMLEDAQVPVLLTQAALRARLPGHGAEVLCLDGDAAWLAGEPTTAPAGTGGPEQLAYVIYTSGSTGRPKGAMNTHRGIGNRLQWMQATYGLTAADRVLQKTPISFDVSVWELFWPLMTGATLVLARPGGHRDPAYLVEAIQRERITVLHFVPSMLQVFLAEPGVEGCGTVRQVICSGEALPYELAQRCMGRLPAARLDNLYGPTEAAVDVTWWRCELAGPRGLVPIGKPVANTQIYIVDGQGEPVPVGVAGELCIGGVQVGRGYWRRPELTAERFVPDPFSGVPGARLYRTGDRARYLADGNIEYLGRLDFQVKIRGFRIELGEIEAVLGQQPGVREVVVVAREDAQGDKRLVAYVVPQEGTEPVGDALRAALRTALPEYMVPAAYVVLPALPLTGSGKVDRRALPAPGPPGSSPGREYTAPRSETERAIAGIWEELLGVPAVGIHDNFFDLGGHSLLATRVTLRISRQLGAQLPARRLFDGPTVADLAACIENGRRLEAQRAEAAEALSRLDELSDTEVDALLARLHPASKDGA